MLRTTIVMMLLISIGVAGCALEPPIEGDREPEQLTKRDRDDGGGGGGGGDY